MNSICTRRLNAECTTSDRYVPRRSKICRSPSSTVIEARKHMHRRTQPSSHLYLPQCRALALLLTPMKPSKPLDLHSNREGTLDKQPTEHAESNSCQEGNHLHRCTHEKSAEFFCKACLCHKLWPTAEDLSHEVDSWEEFAQPGDNILR